MMRSGNNNKARPIRRPATKPDNSRINNARAISKYYRRLYPKGAMDTIHISQPCVMVTLTPKQTSINTINAIWHLSTRTPYFIGIDACTGKMKTCQTIVCLQFVGSDLPPLVIPLVT